MKSQFPKFLILILTILLSHNSHSQKINVNWSPEYEEEKGESLGQVLHDDGEYIYVYVSKFEKRGKDGVTPGIMKFDRKMKPVKREDYTTAQEDIKFNGITYYAGNFMMLTSSHNKESNTTEVYAVTIDKATLQVSGAPKSIYKMSAPKKIDLYWNYDLSSDTSVMMIQASYEQKEDEQRKFAYKVMDGQFNTMHEKAVTLNYTVDDSRILDMEVTNTGEVYLLGKSYQAGAKKETTRAKGGEKSASYDIMLKRYNTDGSTKDFTIPMGKNLLDSYVMYPDPVSSDLYLLGTFQNVSRQGINGYFFMRVDSRTGEVVASKENKFSLPFITRVNKLSDDKTKGENPGISSYFNINTFKVLPDGRIYGILQKDFSVTTTTKYGSYTTYYSQGIIPFLLDKDGNQKWINFIPKLQFYNSLTTYLGYSHMVYKDKLLLFYNDKSKNLEYDLNSDDEPRRFNELKEMSFMMVSIDEKGKMVRKELTNSEQMGTVVYIKGSKQIAENDFMIYGYKFKHRINKLGLATFE